MKISSIIVSVPSFGDSFFIAGMKISSVVGRFLFPSPHSGILFLLVTVSSLRLSGKLRFPSPHSGILFLLEMTK